MHFIRRLQRAVLVTVVLATSLTASCDDAAPGAHGDPDGGGPFTPPPTGNADYDNVSKACRDEAISASKTYYVCDCGTGADASCVAGDDANAGTSPDAPFRTFDKAASTFNALNAGEAVVLCRGGAFPAPTGAFLYNFECSASSPCTFREYEPSWANDTTALPLVYGTNGNDQIIGFEDPAQANHDGGYVMRNLLIDGNGARVGVFLYNDVDDVDLCNLTITDTGIAVLLGDANAVDASDPLANDKNERITLRGSYIHHTSDQGFLGGGPDFHLTSNYFDYCGAGQSPASHSIYISGHSDRITVSHNMVTHSSQAPGGTCEGVALVMHGSHDDSLIEGNRVEFDVGNADISCWGISADPGYGPEQGQEGFRRLVIRGNRVINAGNESIGTTSCVDCLVEDNLVVQGQAFGSYAIAVPAGPRGTEDLPTSSVGIRSNTVVFTSNQRHTGVMIQTDATTLGIGNNAFVGARFCYELAPGVAAGTVVSDYNACFLSSGSPAWGGDNVTLASAQGMGRDAHSIQADPMFVPSTEDDYVPGPGSPLIGAADTATASQWDIDGKARDDHPDIGAFEAR